MKCLSIKQCWVELILRRKKDVEIRDWATRKRGELMLHSPEKIDFEACNVHRSFFKGERIDALKTGCIVGRAEVEDLIVYESLDDFAADYKRHLNPESWAYEKFNSKKKLYGFVLKNAKRFRKTIPLKGQLGIFTVPEEIVQVV